MPEGHVLHRLARELNANFRSAPVEVTSPQGRFTQASLIDGSRLTRATAHGKHLFVDFDAPHVEHVVYIHLGLIGSLRFEPAEDNWGQIRLHISNGTIAANLRGPQFCKLLTDDEVDAIIARSGFDPIVEATPPDALYAKIHRSKRSIGSLLMDQKLFAGVGNIYRAEVLFRQGIDPTVPGTLLSRAQFDAIWTDLVELMAYGVDNGRIDTVRPDHTPETMGRDPRKDDHGGEVYVYRRAGDPCYICGTPIEMKVSEGRKLYWCPGCQ
ncbi:Fpg/Nei family DNA glycosylase [Corynebacterium genitalium ATCC 33030]|uniref:DNA-(apurinic or apyrimidinic site) lyase n=1 Tax=Corynebacterium genitalium ATCC 33030 TaxID=585529 RepID=D7W995_9CORY|nr:MULTISPECIES: DNA-formamidopyrimidine glycosylase family protein [Corynebacterium]EFK55375.1 Formamidopyrimidine-DNA glycosylase H2TH domain protein [Corynebacterium genitalium ATCC 33030]MCQ4624312.1 Fpg/Nei family DNA glycosylase [Corynebacterium sp. CCUG 69979]MCQ4626843.1 Fpg/Nei family DNA glycosylase [Corynebacterium sp. CCUG 65737]UUA89377.1 Fpg/Nei family DNA glycosylase [Corynebacterium genitalium ATCC 33030]